MSLSQKNDKQLHVEDSVSCRSFCERYECSLEWKIDDVDALRRTSQSVYSDEFPKHTISEVKVKWKVELYHIEVSKEIGFILFISQGEMDPKTSGSSCTFSFHNRDGKSVHVVSGETIQNMFSSRAKEDDLFFDGSRRETLKISVSVISRIWRTETVPESLEQGKGDNPILSYLPNILQSSNFSDFVIEVNGSQFPAHRIVLAAHSPVFEAMLIHDFNESYKGIVHISDIDPETIRSMLLYMYTLDEPHFGNCAQAKVLYAASDKYGLKELADFCRKYLLLNTDVSEFNELAEFAELYNDQIIREYLLCFQKKSILTENMEL